MYQWLVDSISMYQWLVDSVSMYQWLVDGVSMYQWLEDGVSIYQWLVNSVSMYQCLAQVWLQCGECYITEQSPMTTFPTSSASLSREKPEEYQRRIMGDRVQIEACYRNELVRAAQSTAVFQKPTVGEWPDIKQHTAFYIVHCISVR